MTLYEIDDRIRECIDEETGEVLDVDLLDSLSIAREEKIEGVACWVKELVYEVEALKAEREKLKKRIEATENKIDGIKKWLAFATGGEKFRTAKAVITFRDTPSVAIDDIDQIPKEFIRVNTEYLPMKIKLMDALKHGTVTGCHIQTNRSCIVK